MHRPAYVILFLAAVAFLAALAAAQDRLPRVTLSDIAGGSLGDLGSLSIGSLSGSLGLSSLGGSSSISTSVSGDASGNSTIPTTTPTTAPTTASPSSCVVKNCKTCVSGSTTRCSTCNTGYTTTVAGLCQMKCRVVNCAVCYATDNTKCATCKSPYKRDKDYLCVRVTNTIIVNAASTPFSLLLATVVVALATAATLL